jgi:hypothetical protein
MKPPPQPYLVEQSYSEPKSRAAGAAANPSWLRMGEELTLNDARVRFLFLFISLANNSKVT